MCVGLVAAFLGPISGCTFDYPGAVACSNGVRDGSETDVDCGGASCQPCPCPKSCATASDCRSGNCEAGVCRPALTRTAWVKATPIADGGSAPSNFFGAGITPFDVAGNAGVLLYGGFHFVEKDGQSLAETWVLRAGAWSQETDDDALPRHYFGIGFHAARQRVVVAGGVEEPVGTAPTILGTSTTMTWTPDGGWELSDATLPDALYGMAIAYDSKRQRLLLFGGNNREDQPSNMLLAMNADSDAWVPVENVSPPGPRLYHGLVYDSARDVLVLFGGTAFTQVPDGDGGTKQKVLQMDDTWEYRADPWPGRWTQVATTGESPPPRYSHAMAYDAQRNRTVLFGGSDPGRPAATTHLDDTWEFDGDCWQLIEPVAPEDRPGPRYRTTMTYDPSERLIVLAGGRFGPAVEDPVDWRYVGLGSVCTNLVGCTSEGRGANALCVDEVCCEQACGGLQRCDQPGHEGTCTDP